MWSSFTSRGRLSEASRVMNEILGQDLELAIWRYSRVAEPVLEGIRVKACIVGDGFEEMGMV